MYFDDTVEIAPAGIEKEAMIVKCREEEKSEKVQMRRFFIYLY